MVEVVIYTSDVCGSCKALKNELNVANIDYYERNISKNPEYRDELVEIGYSMVPVTMICNEADSHYVIGNDVDEIKKHIYG